MLAVQSRTIVYAKNHELYDDYWLKNDIAVFRVSPPFDTRLDPAMPLRPSTWRC